MSNQIDLSQRMEIRNATGDTVGIVLAPKAVQELTTERDQLREETNRLRVEVTELKRALDEAQRAVRDKDAIEAERDLYLRELEEFWTEKIAETQKNGADFREFIAELERDLGVRGTLDGK